MAEEKKQVKPTRENDRSEVLNLQKRRSINLPAPKSSKRNPAKTVNVRTKGIPSVTQFHLNAKPKAILCSRIMNYAAAIGMGI